MYPIQLRLVPGPEPAAIPDPEDVTQICARARQSFPGLEHIRIQVGAERIMLTAFVAADSSTAAAAMAVDIARHIVSTETTVRGWRCATD